LHLLIFVIGTVVTNALAFVMLVRGLRAKVRPECSARAAWCFLLAILQGGVVVASYIAGLSAAFASVAAADPSQKANLLSQNISALLRVASFGVLATFPPFIYACVLFVRRSRLPETN
jgi:hypothetical protein